jgi:OOP family OmpA-OmpF porin
MKQTLHTFAAFVTLVAVAHLAHAETVGDKKAYLLDSRSDVVKSGFGACWHTGSWTPADAIVGCDGMIAKPTAAVVPQSQPVPAPAAAPAAAVAPAPMPAPAPAAAVAAAPTSEKVTFSADALFDFDKAVLKPEGKARLEDLISKLQGTDVEVIVATGHTDYTGSEAYNQKLSMRRAKAVKAFLVSNGVSAERVYAEGKGESQPVADNHTRDGRAKNRRVEIEVVGKRNK